MAALAPLIILSQTCCKLRNESIEDGEDSEVDNRLEKKDFADLAIFSYDNLSVLTISGSFRLLVTLIII